MIVRALLLVAEHHQQLQRRVARALAHAVERAVREETALCAEREEVLRVRIAELKVVVRVVSHTDPLVEVLVEDVVDVAQMLLVEQPVGVDHGCRVGHDLVDELRVLDELLVRIRRDRDHLGEDEVTELLDLGAEFQRLLHLRFLVNDADAVEERLFARLQALDAAGAVVDHAEDERISLGYALEHAVDGGCIGQHRAAAIERRLRIEEAHLDEVHARAHEPLEDFHDLIVAKFPVVHITAVAQRTIKQ